MKTKRIGKMVLMMVFVLTTLASCRKTNGNSNSNDVYQRNDADFAVTNLKTNETVENGGIVIFGSPMEVHRNDSLLLVYKKPQKYANSKFTIIFDAFGKKHEEPNVTGRQYKDTIVVESSLADSTYFIQCKGVSDDWYEGSYDCGSVKVRVSE